MKSPLILSLVFVTTCSWAQTTTGRVRWKSASNIYYTYTGELKNGKPHGRGFARSEDEGDVWIQVFGEFKDGMIHGSTVIRHSTGKIIVANWKENKPEGYGVIITPDKTVEYGNFVSGQMEGKVIRLYADNKIFIDNIKNQASNGRVIIINPQGNIICDMIYANGEANGPGYQYEVEKKQMFEGIWENGNWVRATTGNYPSFMRSSRFRSSVTKDAILVSSNTVKKDNSEAFQDTCFSYDIKENNRWFGYYDQGKFVRGVRLFGDNDRMIGQSDDKGDQGFCVWYQKNQILQVGNYKDHKLDGHGITIDIDNSSIYDGILSEGDYTGNASRLMKNKEIQIGNFVKGNMEGGKIIYPEGHTIVLGYDAEMQIEFVNEIILSDGQKIDPNPKEECTAMNFLLKEWDNNFNTINSKTQRDIVNKSFKVRFTDGLDSWYQFPGAQFNRVLPMREGTGGTKHNEFACGLSVSTDFPKVKKRYDDLCKKLTACSITSLQKGKIIKLVPKLKQLKIDPENNKMASLFAVPDYGGKKSTAMIRVMVEKNYDDKYQLTLEIVSKW